MPTICSPSQLAFLFGAGVISGAINAIAGGGSLLVFPALLAVGVPPMQANVTNSVLQWPGYVGMVAGARRDLTGQRARVRSTAVAGGLGGVAGCLLLLALPGSAFEAAAPVLLVLAGALLALSTRLRRWIGTPSPGKPDRRLVLLPAVFVAAIYGGYFGAALGVILMSLLALTANDTLTRLNAVKAVLSLVVGTAPLVIFPLAAPVLWPVVWVLAPATLVGGYLGMRLAQVMPEPALRWSVVLTAVTATVYLILPR